jgi:5-formyltetrahydrofolate cyclo-ligase
MSTLIDAHTARMALNQDSEVRKWAEAWLKNKERTVQPSMTDQEFEKHWLYVRPERMHEGAVEAVTAFKTKGNEG